MSSDGNKAITGSFDKKAVIWFIDPKAPTMKSHVLDHGEQVVSVVLSPDDSTVITIGTGPRFGMGKVAKVWDVASGKLLYTLQHDADVGSAVFSYDKSKIATNSNKTAKIWDRATGRLHKTLKHNKRVTSVAFNPDSSKVATGSWDQTAKIWNVSDGRLLKTLPHKSMNMPAAWSAGPSACDTKVTLVPSQASLYNWKLALPASAFITKIFVPSLVSQLRAISPVPTTIVSVAERSSSGVTHTVPAGVSPLPISTFSVVSTFVL